MNEKEVSDLLRRKQVTIDVQDPRDALTVALDMGHLSLRLAAEQPASMLDDVTIARLRRQGLVVLSGTTGQQVFEAVDSEGDNR